MTTPSSSDSSRWPRAEHSADPFASLSKPQRGGRGRPRPQHRSTRPDPAPPTPAPPSNNKQKAPSRRPPRQNPVPPSINTQIPAIPPHVASAPPPPSPRPNNRRKRSQNSKLNITSPAANDPSLRASAPRTAPIKDAPPHLAQRPALRHDIDAFVERVRAVAMDNRPSTPGSHIDWAGDDDDTLPDLDDWGVNPSTLSTTISPIIVDGLRPLPDISQPITASPLKQVVTLQEDPPASVPNHENVSSSTPKAATPVPATSNSSKNTDTQPTPQPSDAAAPQLPHKSPSDILSTSDPKSNSTRRHLHPSLPQKPAASTPPATHSKNKSTGSAKPVRSPLPPKPTSATPTTATDTATGDVPVVVEPVPEAPASDPEKKDENAADKLSQDAQVDGLAASMHAPKGLTDSVSAPPTMSSFSHPSRDNGLTHQRAHTVGRPNNTPRSANGDYNSRFPRPNNWARGGFQSPYHARTHSSPPAGVNPNHHRSLVSRPVITGDAISRLARTIGKSSNSSPQASKPQTISTE